MAGHARRDRQVGRHAGSGRPTNLLKTKVTDGILGTFTINANGDTNNNPVTLYKLVGRARAARATYKTITPAASLVKAA